MPNLAEEIAEEVFSHAGKKAKWQPHQPLSDSHMFGHNSPADNDKELIESSKMRKAPSFD